MLLRGLSSTSAMHIFALGAPATLTVSAGSYSPSYAYSGYRHRHHCSTASVRPFPRGHSRCCRVCNHVHK